MYKPAFCICENKGADLHCSDCAANQRLCFRYIDSTIPLHVKPPAVFCGCTARFVSDMIVNSEDRLCRDGAQIMEV